MNPMRLLTTMLILALSGAVVSAEEPRALKKDWKFDYTSMAQCVGLDDEEDYTWCVVDVAIYERNPSHCLKLNFPGRCIGEVANVLAFRKEDCEPLGAYKSFCLTNIE
jgi:hypothetical protein